MFTGIIEATAGILERTDGGLTVARPAIFDDLKEGSSVCVSGVCLSVVAFDADSMRFDVIPETWARTKLGSLKEGESVNLERAMPANGRYDGNVVQGHVEGVGRVFSSLSTSSSSPLPPPPLEEGELRSKVSHNREEGEHSLYKPKTLPANTRYFAAEMRKNPTAAEGVLWDKIRRDRLGARMRRQYVMDGHIFDFYCPEWKLAIEVDGMIHHAAVCEDRERDQFFLEEHGISTIRFTNEEIFADVDNVIERLNQEIQHKKNKHSPPPAEEGVGEEERATASVREKLQNQEEGVGEEERATASIEESLQNLLFLQLPPDLLRYAVPKGAITLDGVALTVVDVQDDVCSVALIPHTLANTTLGDLREGDMVNVETDVIARYLERLMKSRGGSLSGCEQN